jgi:hypothetical protein
MNKLYEQLISSRGAKTERPVLECLVKTSYLKERKNTVVKSASTKLIQQKVCPFAVGKAIRLSKTRKPVESEEISPRLLLRDKCGSAVKVGSKLVQTVEEEEDDAKLEEKGVMLIRPKIMKLDIESVKNKVMIRRCEPRNSDFSVARPKSVFNSRTIFDMSAIPEANSSRVLKLSQMMRYFQYQSKLRDPFK